MAINVLIKDILSQNSQISNHSNLDIDLLRAVNLDTAFLSHYCIITSYIMISYD